MVSRVIRGDGWSITITNEELLTAIEKAPRHVNDRMRYALRDIAKEVESRVIRGMDDYSAGKRSKGAPIMHRTGNLADSIEGHVRGTSLSDLVAVISAGSATVPYARVQEEGDTINAKPGGYLRVPLPDILTERGVVKGNYDIFSDGKGYKTGAGVPTYIAGNAIMIDVGGRPTPIWALVKQVTIPPRLGIRKEIKGIGKYADDRLARAITLALKPPGGALMSGENT